ncbi:pre-mRNA-splicing factor Cef1p [[Candida] railenensis]|uniref:Pre-mRNA-splicing factor CEF1 n=1 Tax=[Candida] railenensis TaxID=45579 RepID=A0A9P0QT17_9ASCO|nr:pre-mRNA-splicing factor Cef1p [[Candida] railenensis]
MPPIYVKGGLWTNVEDEILKAAVSKYGPNQWSRVSSLLVKKTAKQAKARWQEYLNPIVNRSNWTREEDEKLLRLAKLVPNQWRSIAPIMGRTATSCVERYQKLLDDASGYQREQGEDDDAEDELGLAGAGIESLPSTGNNIIGDLNIHPESKPARPDEEDMDEEEREMLSEARARLANTQGKKAKRKARERMLEETKRISQLQKRRELKAAGIKVSIESKNKKKRKEFDYNADIPHEVTPQQGLYDVESEIRSNLSDQSKFNRSVQDQGIQVNDNDKRNKGDKRDKKEKKDNRKREVESIEGEAKSYTNDFSLKRQKLDLPAPDVEMEEGSDDDIDNRILKATLDLKSSQKQKSSLITGESTYSKEREEDDVDDVKKEKVKEDVERSTAVMKSRTDKVKSSLSSLKRLLLSSLSKLPQPQRNPEIVLPSLDEAEEIILTSTEDSSTERFKNIEILKQHDHEKALKRRSQAVQLGLSIPNPSIIKNPGSNVRGLDLLIFNEVNSLLRSDYKRYQDMAYDADLVEDLNEEEYEKVHQEISEEMLKVSQGQSIPSEEILIKTFEAAEASIYKLHDFANKATEIESTISKSTQYQDHSDLSEKLRNNIEALSAESLELDISIKNYSDMQKDEEYAIEARNSRLQGLVDKLVEAEQTASSILRENRR